MDKKTADKLLNETRENYDNFAESFSATRNCLWPGEKKLLEDNWKEKGKVLDIGCGNGRYYELFKGKDVGYSGIDNSSGMVSIAKKKFPGADFRVANALEMPFGANEFDEVISFSVIHHIPSRALRGKLFCQSWRVLKPGGILIVTAWDLRLFAMVRSKQWKRLRGFLKSQIKNAFSWGKNDFGDFFIPWQNKYRRYVHAFTLGELKGLAKNNGFNVEESGKLLLGEREGDLYIVAKKVQN